MDAGERDRFDALMDEAVESLPPGLRQLLEEVPVIVEDFPSPELISELREEGVIPMDARPEDEDLCGLHSGVAFTERSSGDGAALPSGIRLFRRGIIAEAGGWIPQENETDSDVDSAVYEEIMVTLLHEIGHQFGLSEEDLEELGYE